MTRLSNARTAGECCAITAAKAKAVGPVAVPGAADAVFCKMVRANAGIIGFFICSLSLALFGRSHRSLTDRNLLLSVLHHPHIHFAPLLAGVID